MNVIQRHFLAQWVLKCAAFEVEVCASGLNLVRLPLRSRFRLLA